MDSKATSSSSSDKSRKSSESSNRDESSDRPPRRLATKRAPPPPPKKIKNENNDVEEEDEKPRNLCHDGIQANGRVRTLIYLNTASVEYQARIDEHVKTFSKCTEDYCKDQEELMWKSPEDVDQFDVDLCRNKYWMCIWRQFGGHVSHERALQHLMLNEWSIQKALETIDDVLRELPEPYEELKDVEFKFFGKLLWNQIDEGDTKVKVDAQRYRPIDLERFYRHFTDRDTKQVHPAYCNHAEPLCANLDFEPRWACRTCSRSERPRQAVDQKLCLICQTYQEITGGDESFPAHNVHYSKRELALLAQWKFLDGMMGRASSRAEFEERIAEMDEYEQACHRRGQISSEEMELIKKCYVWKGIRTPLEQLDAGKLAALLKPRPLALFRKCEHLTRKKVDQKATKKRGNIKEEKTEKSKRKRR